MKGHGFEHDDYEFFGLIKTQVSDEKCIFVGSIDKNIYLLSLMDSFIEQLLTILNFV